MQYRADLPPLIDSIALYFVMSQKLEKILKNQASTLDVAIFKTVCSKELEKSNASTCFGLNYVLPIAQQQTLLKVLNLPESSLLDI